MGGADWVSSAWKMGDLPGGESYEGYFVVDAEDYDAPTTYMLVRRHHDLDTDEYVDEELQGWSLNTPSDFKHMKKDIKELTR